RGNALRLDEQDSLAAGNASDLSDRNPCNLAGNPLAAGRGEKQFIVVTAMKGGSQVNLARRSANDRPWNGCRLHFGADAAFFANVGEIGGEAIAHIDHCRGQPTFHEEATNLNARAGGEMSLEVMRPDSSPREQQVQCRRRTSKHTSYVDQVPRAAAGT